MNATASKLESENIVPAVDLKLIQNRLESAHPPPRPRSGRTIAPSSSITTPSNGKSRPASRARPPGPAFLPRGPAQGRPTRTRRAQEMVPASFDGREDLRPSCPWNGWDLTMLVLSCLGIVALLTFGVLNISFNLLESGFITFRENALRSYLWAALLPVGALAAKIGWDCLKTPNRRDVYLWTCLGLGMLGCWFRFGRMPASIPRSPRGSMTTSPLSPCSTTPPAHRGLEFAGAKWVNVITLAAQAMAEIFLSAVLGVSDKPLRPPSARAPGQDPVFAESTGSAGAWKKRGARAVELGRGHREPRAPGKPALGAHRLRQVPGPPGKSKTPGPIPEAPGHPRPTPEHLRQHLDESEPGKRLPANASPRPSAATIETEPLPDASGRTRARISPRASPSSALPAFSSSPALGLQAAQGPNPTQAPPPQLHN